MSDFQEIWPRNESTKNAKDAAIKLHKLSKNIERKSKKETSKYLKEHIEDFDNNVKILQTALEGIKSLQKDLNFGFEPITKKDLFGRRQSSFKIKRKHKPTACTSIEDNNQDVEPSTQCQSSDNIEDRKGRTRDREVSYLNDELDKMRRRNKSLQKQLNDKENVIGEARTQFEGELSEIRKRNSELEAILEDKENELRNMRQSLDRTRWETKDLRNQLSNCRRELTTERTEKDKIKAELEDSLTRSRDQKTGTSIEDNNQDEERTFQRSYSDYRPDKKKRTQFERELNEIRKRNSDIEAILQDKENELRNIRKSLDRTRWETEDLKNQLSNCRQVLTTERTEKEKIKAELEDSLTRLSAIASSKLRDNNPNVVDLSDQNRPSKIAEQLSELYDNEWTIAYEVLEDNLSEKECIAALLKMLLDVYNECYQLATNGFYERVQQSIESPFPTKNKPVRTEVKMSDYLKQQIKELRKYRAQFAIEGITEAVAPKIQGDKVKDTDIQAYICKCINICWYMVVQDPPLVFSCGSSGEFDTNVFRSYTRRGPYVDYVVWPALLVSDGSMLSKGIAQGCTSNVDTVSSTVV